MHSSLESGRCDEAGDWNREAYAQAWTELLELALQDLRIEEDPLTLRSLLGAVALARGQRMLGEVLSSTDTSELEAFAEEVLGWS